MKTYKLGLAVLLGVVVGGVAVGVAQDRFGADGTSFLRITPDTVKWMDYPGDGAKFGIKEAYIYGNPTKPGLYVVRLKFPPGVMSTPHFHPESRIGTVIKGTWWTGIGEKFDPKSATPIPVGGIMIYPAGKAHYDGAINEEAIVQMMGIGPTGKKTVDPSQPGFIRVQP